MPIRTIDESQPKAAIAAGWAYLLTFAMVGYVNFGIHDRLMVDGNRAETARHILAHERVFRIGIVGDLTRCVAVVVLLTALYVILKPVSRGLALPAACWRLVWVLMWLVMTLHLFDVLRRLHQRNDLRTFEAAQLQGWARFDYYYVGLLFGSLASTVCGYSWFQSRPIPRLLAALGVIASTWCVACTVIFYGFPNFPDIVNLWWFDMSMAIFDIATSFWLLCKGLSQPVAAAHQVLAT